MSTESTTPESAAENDVQSAMQKLIDELNEKRAHNMMGGGEEKIAK